MFSPRFKSVAAMAGWDEEALVLASLVVEDTPERDFNANKRSDLNLKCSASNSRRKRRAQRRSMDSIPVVVLNLDDEEETAECRKGSEKKKKTDLTESPIDKSDATKMEGNEVAEQSSSASCSDSVLPSLERLREELSCAICLEICFEPSTTPCGHSFCKKCLRSAADKCGKRCPKCRQMISNGRSCTVNTVLWNTIQLLFPAEVEARKAALAQNSREAVSQSPEKLSQYDHNDVRVRRIRSTGMPRRGDTIQRTGIPRTGDGLRSTTDVARQDEDAALALRLQREEFMQVHREWNVGYRRSSSILSARANLRALASRAISLRNRSWPT
ncbi:hypothetical protein Nepgr_027550 [Nepenthes gracilis]|uniref:RING-type E3 ubiquitin transferase n=1 Tax=Nepenthes gracilis TaxID=150966 RepID=A0AAD3Y1B3_NEPGR|nr:hypothetical protein Nepgr_027550 [Nepenthes gracilis]